MATKNLHEPKRGGAHPGFNAIASRISARQGVPAAEAAAELAASTRGASAGAKKANPRLKRVK